MDKKTKKLDWLPYGMLPLPITLKCWESEEFRKEFLENPLKKLKEEGYIFDENTKITVHTNNGQIFHFALPEIPKELIGNNDWKEIWAAGCTAQTTCAATGTCDAV